MLQRFTAFDNISEKMGSFLLRNLTKSEIDYLKGTVDIHNVKDSDILKVEDPKILTKKPYTDYDCVILMFGDNEVKDKTVYGLTFQLRNTYIQPGSNNRYGRKEKMPSRRDLLTNPNFINNNDYYVIFKSKDLDEIRKKRQVKYGALIDPNSTSYYNGDHISNRDRHNDTIAKANRDRYAKGVAEKNNYNDYFKKFEELFEYMEKKKLDAIKKHREYYQENKTVKEYEFLKDFDYDYVSKDLLEVLSSKNGFYGFSTDRDGRLLYDKFVKEMYKTFLDLLEDVTTRSSDNSDKLKKLKLLKTVLDKL